jgi:N-acetylmuramoyl-L-alanine amidase
MRANNIPAHEHGFRTTGIDSGGKKHILTPLHVTVPGSDETVYMTRCKRQNGDESFIYREEKPKKRIVLHHTAGYLKGDIDTLTKPGNPVSVPFVIARDGTIYNLWASKYWSYHLGPGAMGGNTAMSQTSIGIELSNIGYLDKNGANLVTPYNAADVYCRLDETAYYTEVAPYRTRSYFATCTGHQYVSLIKLIRFLTARYDIPRQFVDPGQRFDAIASISSFSGIASHVNFRPSGKWDIGPAFDWERVIKGVTAKPVMLAVM